MRTRYAAIPVIGLMLSACSTGGANQNDIRLEQAKTACTQAGLPAESSEVGSCAARMLAAFSASSL